MSYFYAVEDNECGLAVHQGSGGGFQLAPAPLPPPPPRPPPMPLPQEQLQHSVQVQSHDGISCASEAPVAAGRPGTVVVVSGGATSTAGARMCCDVFGPYELTAAATFPQQPLDQNQNDRQADELRDLDGGDRWIPQIDPTGLDERLGQGRPDDEPEQQQQHHHLQQQEQQQQHQHQQQYSHNENHDPVVERGVGPFLMRYRKQVGPHRLYSCRYARVKGSRCHAYAILTQDGSFVRRKHAHNHRPETALPVPLDRGLRLPLPPTFEEASAVLLTGNMRQLPRPTEEFATSMPVWNNDRTDLVETEITEENCQSLAKKATMEIVNNKKVFHCPVPECNYTFATLTNVYGHMRLHVRGHRIRNSGKAPEKLCPICRQEQGDHARLVRHIVDDHNTRLECTEHEFENVAAFKRWKKLTEEQDLSTFIIGKPQWRQLAGQYSCLRSGRIAGEAADWAARRKLGVECPAAMIVTKAPHSERILVTYWRTHIGHKPSLLDFGLSVETQMWIKDMVERGYKRRAIILEGAKRYFGQQLSRIHCLDNNLFQIVFKKYGIDDKNGTIDVPVKVSDNMNYLRVFLARNIHDHLAERALGGADVDGKHFEEKANIDPHDTIKPGDVRVVLHKPSGHYHLDGLNNQKVCKKENISTVVFARKSPHETCERRCEECGVCVHRYGCTCRTYMYMDRMCSHIHVVAGKQGNPGPEWVDESLAEDTVGLSECLRRLHRLNYRERMITLQPLIDELTDLLKSDHNVDLDQLESVLRTGVQVMRASKPPLQTTRDDDARRVRPMEVMKMRKSCRMGEPDFEVIVAPGKEAELRERQMEEASFGKVPPQMGVFVPLTFRVKRESILDEVSGEAVDASIDTEVKRESTEEESRAEPRGLKRGLTAELQASPNTTWQLGELILPDGTKQSGYVAKVNRPTAGTDVVTLQPRLPLPSGGPAVLKVRAAAPPTLSAAQAQASSNANASGPMPPRGRPIVVRSSRKGPATLRKSGGAAKTTSAIRMAVLAAAAAAAAAKRKPLQKSNHNTATSGGEAPTESTTSSSSSTTSSASVSVTATASAHAATEPTEPETANVTAAAAATAAPGTVLLPSAAPGTVLLPSAAPGTVRLPSAKLPTRTTTSTAVTPRSLGPGHDRPGMLLPPRFAGSAAAAAARHHSVLPVIARPSPASAARTPATGPLRLLAPTRSAKYAPFAVMRPPSAPTASVTTPSGGLGVAVKACRPLSSSSSYTSSSTTPTPPVKTIRPLRPTFGLSLGSSSSRGRVYTIRAIAPTSASKAVRRPPSVAQTMIVRAAVPGCVGMNSAAAAMQRPVTIRAGTATNDAAKKEPTSQVQIEDDGGGGGGGVSVT